MNFTTDRNKPWVAELIAGLCFMCPAGTYRTDGTKRKSGKDLEWSLCSFVRSWSVLKWPFTLAVLLCEQGDAGITGDIGVKGDQVRGAGASFSCPCTSRLCLRCWNSLFSAVFSGSPWCPRNQRRGIQKLFSVFTRFCCFFSSYLQEYLNRYRNKVK